MSTTALNLVQGALRRVNAYQSGEPIAPLDAQDCLDTLNDLFDSLSTDHNSIVGSIENILTLQAQQAQYTVGNPLCTDLGFPPFTGTLSAGSNLITGVTNIPTNLVSGSAPTGSYAGSALTELQNLLPPLTYVTGSAGNTVTMSAAALGNSTGLDTFAYSVPGDFGIPRPLNITNGFTRINQLDFTIEVTMSRDRFLEILYKAQPGPWPTVAWYNPQMPYGILEFYQTPGNNAELHLFTDTILGNLTLNQVFYMPQGYNRWIKWLLAKEICAEFGYPMTEAIKTNAADAESKIKALNAKPAVVAKYDRMLSRGNRANAGWIITGGDY